MRDVAALGGFDGDSPHLSDMMELFVSVLESSHDGIYITDGAANTIIVNRSYEQITGLSRSDLLGRNMRELVQRGVIDGSGTLLALEKGGPVTIEQKLSTGKRAAITSVPHFDKDGRVTMVVSNVRDVTEIHTLRRQLTQQEEREKQHLYEIEVIRKQIVESDTLVAVDEKMLSSMLLVQKVAGTDIIVMLLGETGVGKEVVATYIHQSGNRAQNSLIKVNCGAIPPHLVESELFGYEKGAFTGASKDGKPGLFEVADKGTIFLDEVGDLPLEVQVKLLRVIQDKEIQRVGALKPKKIDVRIIAATNRNLEDLVAQSAFRKDLYYRLNVFPITVPPLRERPKDILPLAEMVLKEFNHKYSQNRELTAAAQILLQAYEWPGNVRELRNVLVRAAVLSTGDAISPLDLGIPQAQSPAGGQHHLPDQPIDLKVLLESIEADYIRQAIAKHQSVRRAAKSLCLDPATFLRKRNKYDLG
ncbi:MAG: sigma 54-interacting transcriptional regulator [Oscillospiraceae bacterium]|nr:sigma 54-interacting transcriptional regulator [Oscillospiraceae bacterium]